MSASVLVCYGTVYGSTAEVAQSIAADLREAGYSVDVLPAKQVKSLQGYQAVVLGAPLYIFRWQGDARRFLARFRKALQALPVAVFALGPFHNKEDELESARTQLAKELAQFPWLAPLDTGVFVGKFDPARLRFPYSLIGPLKKMPPSDERDWSAITAWGQGLASKLQSSPVPAGPLA